MVGLSLVKITYERKGEREYEYLGDMNTVCLCTLEP